MAEQTTSLILLTDMEGSETLVEHLTKYSHNHPLGLIYLGLKRFDEIVQQHGEQAACRLLQTWRKLVLESQRYQAFAMLTHRMFRGDVLLFFRLEQAAAAQLKGALSRLAHETKQQLEQQLRQYIGLPGNPIELCTGSAVFVLDGTLTGENQLYEGFKEAMREAQSGSDTHSQGRLAEFRDILARQQITAHYQPIVALATGSVYGYEALARGPQASYFSTPSRLWDFAEKTNQLYVLEKVARQRAIEGFLQGACGWKLFINLNANVVHDPQFTPGQTLAFLKKTTLTPQDIVFEITERQSIADYASFTRALGHYRQQGYRIAIDDAGAGYSSLQAIAELRPDYIKIDRSIIHGIDRDPVKAMLLETMVLFAQKVNCQIIAEGIETMAELKKVMQLGVHFGQGYLLGRPKPQLHAVAPDLMATIWRKPLKRMG